MIVVQADLTAVAVALAVLLGTVAIWTFRLRVGVTYRPVLNGLMVVFYLALFFLVETGNWLGVDANGPIDIALLALGVVLAARYTFDSSRIIRRQDGHLGHRGSSLVPVIWLSLFLLELYLQVELFGSLTFLGFVSVQGIPGSALPPPGPGWPSTLALVLVDGLFALSTGVMVGHFAGIYARFARRWWRRSHSTAA